MTVVVIDGYNLIRRVPELCVVEERQGLEAGRMALEVHLAGYSAAHAGTRLVLVYDGPTDSGGQRSVSAGGLTIRFSDRADESVVELAGRFAGQGEQVRTVSSDRAGVGAPLAGVRRVMVLSAEEFWRTLAGGKKARGGKAGPPGSSAGRPEKPTRVSKAEVSLWLEAFGAGERAAARERPEGDKPTPGIGAASGGPEIPAPGEAPKSPSTEELKARRRARHARRQKRGK